MPAARRASAAQPPSDLSAKRPASVTPLEAVQAETRAERLVDEDGAVSVTLQTKNGSGDFRVPPFDDWTSIARNALNRNDDLTWAQQTLTPVESIRWMQLNPTLREFLAFTERYGEILGQSLGG